jgi:hypothetical protein
VYGLTRISAGSERLDSMSNEDDPHVEANVEVIREYLRSQFKGFELTEKRDHLLSYTFAVTKSSDERYQIKVSWPQLSDHCNTPERTKQRLFTDDVAGRMKGKSQGEYFWWGKY